VNIRRLLLSLPLLFLLIIASAWFWLLHTQSGAQWIWSRVESAADGSLSAASITGSLSSELVAGDVTFIGDSVNVAVGRASLSIDIDLLPIKVNVLSASVSDLRIDLAANDRAEDDTNLHDTLNKLQLPVELAFEAIALDGGVINGIDQEWSFVVNSLSAAGTWADAIALRRVELDGPLANASGSGSLSLLDQHDVQLDVELLAKAELTTLDDAIPVTATVQGPLDDLVVQARADEPRALLHGRLAGVTDSLRWEAQLDLPAFALPRKADGPDIPPLELSAQGGGDLQTFAAEAQVGFAGTDMHVTIGANVDIAAANVSADADWQNAHWPVGDAEPQVSSRTGNVTLSGSLDDWTVAGTIALDVSELPPGTLKIEGAGDRDGASARILEGNVLGGLVAGRVEYSWRGPQPFSARLEFEAIKVSTVMPDFPAVLSGNLDLDGRQQPLQLSVQLSDIAGSYDGRTLRANGRLDIDDDGVSANDFRIGHGETRVRVDGDLYAAAGLRYDLYVDDFGFYLDDAFGSIAASGSVSLKPNEQLLRIDASSEEFGWRDVRIVNLAITDHGNGVLDAVATADNVEISMVDAGQLRLQVQLGKNSQSIDIETSSDGLRSLLSVSGALDHWESPSSWSGQLTKLEIEHDDFSTTLDEPAAIAVSKTSASIDKYCSIGRRGTELCMAGSWDTSSGLDLTATLASLQANLVNAFVETGTELDQVVNGGFRLQVQPDGSSTGRGDIAMTPGRIVSTEDPDLYVDTGQVRFGFDISDDDLRSGNLNIPFPGLGQIAADFEILDVADQGSADVNGSIDVDLEDFGLLIALFPIVDSADGTLRANLDIGGTVDDPLIRGNLALENGALTYLPAGLKLDEIELSSELQDNGEIELNGSFRAGEGRAEIRTRADHARTAATGLELTLRGENLTVIDVPDVTAVADTDLRVNFDGKTLVLNGDISFPRARIRPANIGATRVYESEDVIIVAGELPDEPIEDGPAADIEFAGTVVVALGNDVIVDLEVTEVQVTGSTEFTWLGGPIPNAVGRYDVDGTILAYGQRLEITEGSIRFEDVPADDPYLRIRAEREIFGNTQVRQAGVLVAGNLSRPTIEAYTNPMTTEERALTLLVTGSEIDYERGVGAVDFGTYIAPRVYASYGIGLFDNENIIRIRYDLKRGFGVTATSGARESGLDLSYRFEN
jgi:translocation and assembly module TamB